MNICCLQESSLHLIRSTISCELSCDSCKIAGVILIVFPKSLSNANDQRPPQGTFNGESFLLGIIALEADVIIWKYHRGVRENPNIPVEGLSGTFHCTTTFNTCRVLLFETLRYYTYVRKSNRPGSACNGNWLT